MMGFASLYPSCADCEPLEKDEVLDRGNEIRGLLHMGQVPAFRNDHGLRPRNEFTVGLSIFRWEQLVLGAPDQESRYVDPVQPLVQMRIVAVRLPGQLRPGDAVLHGDAGTFL